MAQQKPYNFEEDFEPIKSQPYNFDEDFEPINKSKKELSGLDWWVSQGARTIPAVAGGIIGGAAGAGAGGVGAIPGAMGGGAIGSAIGNTLGQGYEWLRGYRDEFNPWEFGVETALGAVPPIFGPTKPLTSAGLKEIAKYAGKSALSGAAEGAIIGGSSVPFQNWAQDRGFGASIPEIAQGASGGAVLGGVTGGGLGAYHGRQQSRGLSAIADAPTTDINLTPTGKPKSPAQLANEAALAARRNQSASQLRTMQEAGPPKEVTSQNITVGDGEIRDVHLITDKQGWEPYGINPKTQRAQMIRRSAPLPTVAEGPKMGEKIGEGTTFDPNEGFTLTKEEMETADLEDIKLQGYELVGLSPKGDSIFKRFIEEESGSSSWEFWAIDWIRNKLRKSLGREPSPQEIEDVRQRSGIIDRERGAPVIPDMEEAGMMGPEDKSAHIDNTVAAVDYWQQRFNEFAEIDDVDGMQLARKNMEESERVLAALETDINRSDAQLQREVDNPSKDQFGPQPDIPPQDKWNEDPMWSENQPPTDMMLGSATRGHAKAASDDAYARAHEILDDGGVDDAHKIIHDAADKLNRSGFANEAEQLVDDWNKHVDEFFTAQEATNQTQRPLGPNAAFNAQLGRQRLSDDLWRVLVGMSPSERRTQKVNDLIDGTKDLDTIDSHISALDEWIQEMAHDKNFDEGHEMSDMRGRALQRRREIIRESTGPGPDTVHDWKGEPPKLGDGTFDHAVKALNQETDLITLQENLDGVTKAIQYHLKSGNKEELNLYRKLRELVTRRINDSQGGQVHDTGGEPTVTETLDEINTMFQPGNTYPRGTMDKRKDLMDGLTLKLMREMNPVVAKQNLDEISILLEREDLTEGQRETIEFFRSVAEDTVEQGGMDAVHNTSREMFGGEELPEGGIDVSGIRTPSILREADINIDAPEPIRFGQQELPLGPHSELVPRELESDQFLSTREPQPLENAIPNWAEPEQAHLPEIGDDVIQNYLRNEDVVTPEMRDLATGEVPKRKWSEKEHRFVPIDEVDDDGSWGGDTANDMGGPPMPPQAPPPPGGGGPNPPSNPPPTGPTPPAQSPGLLNRLRRSTGIGMGGYGAPVKPKLKRGQKAPPTIGQQLWSLPTQATTIGDFTSAVGRQGLASIHTPEFWKSLWTLMKGGALTSKRFDAAMAPIYSDPLYRPRIRNGKPVESLGEELGVSMIENSQALSRHQTGIAGNWIETGGNIPGFSKLYRNTVGRFFAASNRHYALFLNHLRANRFKSMMENSKALSTKALTTGEARPGFLGLVKQKYTPQEALDLNGYTNSVRGKEIADYVMTATGSAPLKMHIYPGRGGEKSLEFAAGALSKVFFSPKQMASRMRMLNPLTYVMASPQIRKQYLHSAMATAAMWYSTAKLGEMAGAEVVWDPTSADFGKIKIGNTRLDPAGGFQQFLVDYARIFYGGVTSSSNQQFQKYGEGFRAETLKDTQERFFSNKFNPLTKFAYDLINSSTYIPFHVGDRTAQLFVPLIVQDGMELLEEDTSLWPVMLGVNFGMGTQTYEKGESVSKLIAPENDWIVKGGGVVDLLPEDVTNLWQ